MCYPLLSVAWTTFGPGAFRTLLLHLHCNFHYSYVALRVMDLLGHGCVFGHFSPPDSHSGWWGCLWIYFARAAFASNHSTNVQTPLKVRFKFFSYTAIRGYAMTKYVTTSADAQKVTFSVHVCLQHRGVWRFHFGWKVVRSCDHHACSSCFSIILEDFRHFSHVLTQCQHHQVYLTGKGGNLVEFKCVGHGDTSQSKGSAT